MQLSSLTLLLDLTMCDPFGGEFTAYEPLLNANANRVSTVAGFKKGAFHSFWIQTVDLPRGNMLPSAQNTRGLTRGLPCGPCACWDMTELSQLR